MGLGFMNGKRDIEIETRYDMPVHPPHLRNQTDIWKVTKGIGGIIATLVLLGGLIWGAAFMIAGMASDEDLDKVEDRIELVEKNDIRQTVILEQIKEALEVINGKLDKALKK